MDYCQEIVGVIEDYRYKDRRNNVLKVNIDKNHVEKWVSQFDDHHEIILEETLSLLKSFYFSKKDIGKYLNDTFSNKKYGVRILKKIFQIQLFWIFKKKVRASIVFIKRHKKKY